MRHALGVALGALAVVLLPVSPALADSTVVVRGLDFAPGTTNLAITGCPGLFDRVAEPVATYLSRSPEGPAGHRSLAYDLGGGNAVGSQHQVSSMAATTVAGLSLNAPDGSTGVAYAGYQAPADWGSSLVWVGRAELSEPPGSWRQVDAPGLTYTWTQYDFATRQPVESTGLSVGVAEFMAGHGGDGPGFYAVGFGCDGAPYKIDALRIGSPGDVTTYDLEGFTSTTAITGSTGSVTAGDPVRLGGILRDGRGQALPHGLLILEAQEQGSGGFAPVEDGAVTVDDGDPSVSVEPSRHTVYRWRFAGTWSVDGSISPPFVVRVRTAVSAGLDDSAVGSGGPVVVTGEIDPVAPGLSVTLWRVGEKGRSRLATTEVDRDGAFRFEVPGPSEEYVVTVPATAGNLAGEGAVVRVPGATR